MNGIPRWKQPGFWILSLLMTFGAMLTFSVIAQLQNGVEASRVFRGGKLYDNWLGELQTTAPKSNHPLWSLQKTNTRSGDGTWRCRECILKGSSQKDHDFSQVLAQKDIEDLALFLKYGLVDMNQILDLKTGKATGGNLNSGKAIFNVCAGCHGADGKALNFRTAQDPEYVGTVANANPWGLTHRAWVGVANTPMPGMFGVLSKSRFRDLVRYVQTLPVK
jgi:mono/diheme cytochrome c family protein